MAQFEVILQHGWGFNRKAWHAWLVAATAGDIAWKVCDRGYFNEPHNIDTFSDAASKRILVTHSLGLHLLPAPLLQQCDLLVAVSGFEAFNAGGGKTRVLARMKRKLPEQPQQVLQDFYLNCYGGNAFAPPEPAINVDLLLWDLDLLAEHSLSLEPLHKTPQILLLHGAADNVASVKESQRLQSLLPNAHLVIHPHAGHALPFTHSAWCLKAIYATLKSPNSETQLNLAVPG